jgi:hypothetical protein
MTYARICEVRPRKDRRGVNLISDALPMLPVSTHSSITRPGTHARYECVVDKYH